MRKSSHPARKRCFEPLETRRLLAADLQLVSDLNTESTMSDVGILKSIGETTFFAATDKIEGPSLWKTDGTEAGTTRIKSLDRYPDLHNPVVSGGELYFTVARPDSRAIWKSDGTESVPSC